MAEPPPRELPVQRFQPSSGGFLGRLGLAVAALLVGVVAVTDRDLGGLRICLGLAISGVVVWMVLLRPKADVYGDTLVLHHAASDTHIPLVLVEAVSVRHAMTVFVGDHKYVCTGIGRSTRSLVGLRDGGPRSMLPGDTLKAARSGATEPDKEYGDFVEKSIDDLARLARRDMHGEPPPVRKTLAVPELAALTALTIAFLLTLAF